MGWNGGTQSSFHPVQLGSKRKNGLRNHWHPHWQGSGTAKKLWSLLELFTLLGPIMARNYACWFISSGLLMWSSCTSFVYYGGIMWCQHLPFTETPTGAGAVPPLPLASKTSGWSHLHHSHLDRGCLVSQQHCQSLRYLPQILGKCYKSHPADESSTSKIALKNDMLGSK